MHLLFLSFSSFAASVLPKKLRILNKLYMYMRLHIIVKSSLHPSDAPKSSSGSPGELVWKRLGAFTLGPHCPSQGQSCPWAEQAGPATSSQNPHQKLKIFMEEIPILAISFELHHGKQCHSSWSKPQCFLAFKTPEEVGKSRSWHGSTK